jgi:hypothetical protein
MSNVAKLTEAVFACPPDLDCYQHGAAVYYGIPYADVSPQQRAAVKSLTWLARYSEGHHFDPLTAGRVHDEIVIAVDPAHHERVVESFARVMNQPARKALLDLDTLTRLVPDNLLDLAANPKTFPRPNRFRWDAEYMNDSQVAADSPALDALSIWSITGRRHVEYTSPMHELSHSVSSGPITVSFDHAAGIDELFQRAADAMNVPVRFVDPQRGLSLVNGETEFATWTKLVDEQRAARTMDVRHIDWLNPPKPKVWPRDYPEDVVRDVLGFVARGEFTFGELWDLTIARVAHPYTGRLISRDIARTSIRRAKLERRIRWCPYSQRYVARPAWQHRPKHDRRGWTWPR